MRVCSNCPAWHANKSRSKYDEAEDSTTPTHGQCRLHGPVVIDSAHNGRWPVTTSEGWCIDGQTLEVPQ